MDTTISTVSSDGVEGVDSLSRKCCIPLNLGECPEWIDGLEIRATEGVGATPAQQARIEFVDLSVCLHADGEKVIQFYHRFSTRELRAVRTDVFAERAMRAGRDIWQMFAETPDAELVAMAARERNKHEHRRYRTATEIATLRGESEALRARVEKAEAECVAWRKAWDGREEAEHAVHAYADPDHEHDREGYWDEWEQEANYENAVCESCQRFLAVREARTRTGLIGGAP